MEIVGRLTANAEVNEVKTSGHKVINFTVAVNDSYKPKDGELKTFTTYFNCSYWRSAGIATHLNKGSLVEINGRVSVNAWKNMDGEPKASLNFHVNNIKLHGKGGTRVKNEVSATGDGIGPNDDLPF